MASQMHSARLLVILLFSPAVILAVHMVITRLARKRSPQIAAVRATVAGILPVGALLWICAVRYLVPGERWTAVLYSLVSYCAIAVMYFHFFNMSETARRIRILYEIHVAGSLPVKAMESLYRSKDIIDIRLQRLVAMKQLRQEGRSFSLGRRTVYLGALIVFFWRAVLSLDEN